MAEAPLELADAEDEAVAGQRVADLGESGDARAQILGDALDRFLADHADPDAGNVCRRAHEAERVLEREGGGENAVVHG